MTQRLATLLLVLATACVGPEGFFDVVDRIPPVPEGMARFYFFRPASAQKVHQPLIRVNDTVAGKAVSDGFLFLDVPPGDYTVTCSNLTEHARDYTLAAGDIVYARLRITVGVHKGRIVVEPTTLEAAREEVERMNYVGDPSLLL